MKKIKILLVMLFVFLIGVSNVEAMTLKPTGSSTGKRGQDVILYITLSRTANEKEVSAIDGILSYDENVLTLSNVENLMGSGWTEFSSVVNNKAFSYANLTFNTLISDTNKNIVKLVFKVNSNAKSGNTVVSVSNPSATDEEGNGVSINGGSHTFKVLSDVNTLSDLTVSDGTINFEDYKTTYGVNIDNSSVTITAIKSDSASTISGDIGTKVLNYGLNTFKITVTSESGISNVYTLNITRSDNRKTINTLDSLEISDGEIKFNKNTVRYSVDVENNISSITVKATLTDETSSFVSGYGPRTVTLKEGTNSVIIKVRAENGLINTYTINVTRKSDGTKSDNNYLSELTLSDGTINFNKDELYYKVMVLYDVEKIKINVKTDDNKAIYKIVGSENLVVGKNDFIVSVIAESGATREYVIVVERKDKDEKLSGNAKLKSLTISGYKLDFDSEVYNYSLNINNENSLIIDYTLDDENSSVNIEGNSNLQDGSRIKILVTAEDGTVVEYKIDIEKDSSIYLLIFIIIGIIILLFIIVMLLFKNKKDKVNNMNITENTVDLSVSNDNVGNYVSNEENIIYSQNVQTVQESIDNIDIKNNTENN